MKVYINWYHGVLEGELLDGEFLGMRQVRIPLDGCHPIALFKESHIYASADEADKNRELSNKKPVFSNETRPFSNNNQPLSENTRQTSENTRQTSDDTLVAWRQFKLDHWDHEHNHLQIDALEEFYKLYRNVHDHYSFIPPSPVSCDSVAESSAPIVAILPQSPPPLPLHSKPQPKKLTKKQLRSAEAIQFTDSVQTSIFDLL